MNEQVTLISIASEGDSFDRVTNESRNVVFCEEKSITQSEFFETSSRGLKAEHKLEIWSQDYNGETLAEYGVDKNGKPLKYQIYRTFKKHDITEIYLASEG